MSRSAPDRRRDGGFTIIEIMIAMAVGSLLIGMIFAIYTRMSVAYRSQSRVTEVNQTVRAAAAMLAREMSMAGFMIPDGDQLDDEDVVVAPNNGIQRSANACTANELPAHVCATSRVRPVYVTNKVQFASEAASAGDPDQIFFYGADPEVSARVIDINDTAVPPTLDVAAGDGNSFANGDVAVLVRRVTVDRAGGTPNDAIRYFACLVEITTAGPNLLTLDPVSAYNEALMTNCSSVVAAEVSGLPGYRPMGNPVTGAMLYKFWGRGYRIDPSAGREGYGVLQYSQTALLNPITDWEDLALGVTNLQFATQYLEVGDGTDRDGDGSTILDWYSSTNMTHPHGDRPSSAVIRTVSITVEARTTEETDAVGTSQSPSYGGGNYDMTGDFAGGYNLKTGTQPARYQGDHVYRWSTTRVDIRNSAVDR